MLRIFSSILLSAALLATWSEGAAQTAAFSASPKSGCSPLVVNFSDQSMGPVAAYQWNLGNGVTPTTANPSTTYSTPGIYVVSLITTGASGTDTATDTVVVYGGPAISFVGDTLAGCTPRGVRFFTTVVPNAPGPVTYSWTFGDGYTDTGAAPYHIYRSPGTFRVSVIATNGPGCPSSAIRDNYVTSWPLPVLAFSADNATHCSAPATVLLTATASGSLGAYSYQWDFGDNTAGTGSTVSHTYAADTFTVTGIVTDARGCRDTVAVPDYIKVLGLLPSFVTRNTCEDSAADFRNTSGTTDIATWDFGDGTSYTGNLASHRYPGPGTYTVRMSVLLNNCPKTAVQTVRIFPVPKPALQVVPPIPCPAPITIKIAASSNMPATFTWRYGNGSMDAGDTVSKFYPRTKMDTVRLIARSADGCVGIIETDTIYIREPIHWESGIWDTRSLVGMPHHVLGCRPFDATHVVDLRSNLPPSRPLVPYPAPITSYRWDFSNGGSSTLPQPQHWYYDTGMVYARLIITTGNGCTDTGFFSRHIKDPVRPVFRVSKDTLCPNDVIRIYNLTRNVPAGTRFWITAADTFWRDAQLDSFDLFMPTMGGQPLRLTLHTFHEDCVDTASTLLTIHPPNATFTWNSECWPSRNATFVNTSVRASRYLWNFDDGTYDTAMNPVHTYAVPGSYRPILVSYHDSSGCTDTVNSLTAIRILDPGFRVTFPAQKVCAGVLVPIDITYPGHMTDPYPWFVRIVTEGDTSNWLPGGGFYTRVFRTEGIHDVTVIFQYGSTPCIFHITYQGAIEVSKPIVRFSADATEGCAPFTTLLRDSSSNALPGRSNSTYSWFFGDGTAQIGVRVDTIVHTYHASGDYNVTLIVEDSTRCRDTLLKKLYIKARTVIASVDSIANGFGPDSVCLNAPVGFRSASSGSPGLRLLWSFGDGTTDTGIAPIHRYTSRGRYKVRHIAIDAFGCTDTVERAGTITVLAPIAGFSLSPRVAVCPPLNVSFTDQSTGADRYLWDFGDGTPVQVVIPNPVNSYRDTGIYRVTLHVTDGAGCSTMATDSVQVLGYKGALRFDPPTGCRPSFVTFSPTVPDVASLIWDFGDGFTDTTRNSAPTTHVYTSAGAFLPKVIFSDGQNCSALSTALDSVYVDEVRADFNWSVPCADTPFTLTSLSTAVYGAPNQFRWSAPAATGTGTGTGSPGQLNMPAGTHPVTLIATNAAGCADTITKDVLINALPPVYAGTDTAVCPGDTVRLVASGAISYTWATAAGGSGPACTTCPQTHAWPQQDAVYTLSGRDANGCYGRDSVTVRIQIKTTSTSGPGGAICYGQSYRLSAAGADTYQWLPAASIDSPNAASPLATPKTSTTYVVISQEGTCQVDTQRIPVTVYGLPDFSAGPDKIIALGAAATLEPRGTYKTIRWLGNDSTLSCLDCPRPNATPHYTRTYWATVTDENGCESTDSVTVHVRCNGSYVFIPNTFTPNGDGQNDWFYPQGSGLEGMRAMRIFNRWGQLVFESMNVPLNSATAGWDGRFKGEALAPDTYFYVMSSRCSTGEVVEFKGDVTLIR